MLLLSRLLQTNQPMALQQSHGAIVARTFYGEDHWKRIPAKMAYIP
jgi:hypothetical protein